MPSQVSAWPNAILLEGEHASLNGLCSGSHQNKDALLELPAHLDPNETLLISSGALGQLESKCQQSSRCNFLEVLSSPAPPPSGTLLPVSSPTLAQLSEPEFRSVELKQ